MDDGEGLRKINTKVKGDDLVKKTGVNDKIQEQTDDLAKDIADHEATNCNPKAKGFDECIEIPRGVSEEENIITVAKDNKKSSIDIKAKEGKEKIYDVWEKKETAAKDKNETKVVSENQKELNIQKQQKYRINLQEQVEIGQTEDELESWRNIICFFCLGVITFLHKETSLTAAQDILTGSDVPTSTFLIVTNIPLMAVKVTLPWFMQRIPYPIRIATAAIVLSLAYLLVGLGTSVTLRLLGVAFGSTMHPVAEVTVLSLTPHFSRVTMLAFSSGLGVSSFLASGVYTGIVFS